jgi:hypothetical protein
MSPLCFACCWMMGFAGIACAAESKLQSCATIQLPGVEGRLDHIAVDPKSQRLFVAALGNNSLEIVGLREGRRVQSISGMKSPTGVAYLPRLNWVCVGSSGDGTVRIYDAGNYQPKQVIRGLEDADNLRYVPETDLVYAGYGKGGLALLDGSQGQIVGMIELKAHPESFQIDVARQIVFVNVPDARQITVLDLKKRDVLGGWPLGQAQANFPMALDTANHRLMVGCRRPARLLVLDTQSAKAVAEVPIVGDCDDLFLDSKRHRLYASGGEGAVDVIEQVDADHYRVVEKVPTVSGARTSFFSEDLDLYAVAVPRRGKEPAEIRVYQPR